MSIKLVYFNQHVVFHPNNHHLPGFEKFSSYFKIFGNATIATVDRTDTIRLPYQTANLFPLPKLMPMKKSFEELCNDRAVEILTRCERLGSTVHVFWSGGIDSTLVLVSLLKNATPEQKKNIVVLMTDDSILENPVFYREHVRGKLRADSATMFPYLLGTNNMLIGGEGNDQLFGSDIMLSFIVKHGPSVINRPWTRELLFSVYNDAIGNPEITNFYIDLFERLSKASPTPIVSLQDFLWWINFSLKWQSVFVRLLSYTAPRHAEAIQHNYIQNQYDHFFSTEQFQLWSMNNMDKKIKDEWRTYKWVCKDIIYDYTKDADYRDNKIKRGSLFALLLRRSPYNFIGEGFKLYENLTPEEYMQPKNDFV